MPDALEFILQGTDGLSPVVDQGTAAVTRLDAAGQRAFVRLVDATLRYQTTLEATNRELDRLHTLQQNTVGAEKQEAIGRRIEAVIDQQILAEQRLITTEKQWAVTAEDSAQRVVAARQREIAAAQKAATAAAEAAQQNSMGGKLDSLVTGFMQGVGQQLTGFLTNTVVGAFQAVGQAAQETFGFVVTATADQQSALVTYARQLHDVAGAYKEMAAVKTGAVLSSRELPEVINLDQTLLARFKTIEAVEAASGRTFQKVRTDILDTSATLHLTDEQMQRIGIDLQEILSGQNVGRALQSLNMITGVTRDELMAQGVQFDKAGTHIVSSYDQAFRAVLTVLEQRYAGMDALQSRTFNGMMSNVSDLGRMFASELGEKSVGVATGYITRWMESIVNNPQLIPTLELWGDRLGRITDATFRVFDTVGRGAQTAYTVLKPFVDLFGTWLDHLPAAEDGMTALMARAAAAGPALGAGFEDAAQGVQAVTAATAAAERQQKTLGREVEDTRTAYARLIQVQRDRTTAVKRDEEDIRYATDQANIPLHDKITLLDRIYEATHKETDLAKLNREIARDQALSKDQFSSEGRAAGLRLVGEEQQRADLIAGMAHDKEKARLQDSITANERTRDVALHGKAMEQRGIEDTIAKYEAQQRAAEAAYRKEQRQVEDRITWLRNLAQWQATMGQAAEIAAAGVRQITGAATGAATGINTVNGRIDDTSTHMGALETRLQGFVTVARGIATNIFVINEAALVGIEFLARKSQNAAEQTYNGVMGLARQAQDMIQGIDPSTDTVLRALDQRQRMLQIEDGALTQGFGTAAQGLSLALATGNYQTYFDQIDGKNNPANLNVGRGSPSFTAPPTPAPPVPHQTNVHVSVELDADGQVKKIRQVVKDELGNPQNSDAMGRTLAPLLARSR